MENRTIWLEQRQSQQELLGGDDTYGNGGWECLGADCTTVTSSPWNSCSGTCLHFDANGGSNAGPGAQRTIAAAPIVNGGNSFTISFNVDSKWTPTGTATARPTDMIHFTANVGGTTITKEVGVGTDSISSSWYPFWYQGFLPQSYSSSTVTITLGLDANIPTGTGYYQIWIDSISLTVPPSTSSGGTSSNSGDSTSTTSTSPSASTISTSAIIINGSTVISTMMGPLSSSTNSSVSSHSSSNSVRRVTVTASSSRGTNGAAVGNAASDNESPSSNQGVLIGGIIAGIAVLILAILLAWCLVLRRIRRNQSPTVDPFQNPMSTDHLAETYPSTPLTNLSTVSHELNPNEIVSMSEHEPPGQWVGRVSESLPAYQAIHFTRRVSANIPSYVNEAEVPERRTEFRVVGEDEVLSSNGGESATPTKKGNP